MSGHDQPPQPSAEDRPTTEQLLVRASRLAREVADHLERLARLRGER